MTATVAATLVIIRVTMVNLEPGHVSWGAVKAVFIAVATVIPAAVFAIIPTSIMRLLRIAIVTWLTWKGPMFTVRPIHGLYAVCVVGFLAPLAPLFLRAHPPAAPGKFGKSTVAAVSPVNSGGVVRMEPARTVALLAANTVERTNVVQNEAAPSEVRRVAADVERELSRFIVAHHRKSSAGDIDALLEDYADQVENYNEGFVDKSSIRKEEEGYHAVGFEIVEVVKLPLQRTVLTPVRTRVEYPLSFLRVSPDGSWVKGVTDVTLEVVRGSQGLEIVKQSSKSRDEEKRKGRGALPAL